MTRAGTWFRRATLVAVVAASAVGWAERSAAEPLDKDADAERLFREGQQLMGERRYGEACPKFEAAYRKDQQLGTLLNLAYCHKEQGAIWLAWVEFKEAEVKAIELKRSDRRDFARQRMLELEKQLGKAVIEPQSRVELTEVLVEDRRVPDAEKGQTFAIEMGQRKLTFRAKGKKQAVQLVTITKGPAQKIAVPEMEEQPKEAPPVAESGDEDEPRPVSTPVTAEKSSDGASQRVAGLVLAGVGVVGIGVGSVTGLMTFSSPCSGGKPCEPDEEERADVTSMTSNIAFAAGGTFLVGGLLLYFLAPKAAKTSTATVPPSHARSRAIRLIPEIGAGWAGLRGAF